MIDDFADPEFFPGKLKMMEKKRPQSFLLTGMSDLSGWKPEWRDEVFVKIRENPQHQFLFLTKRPDLLDFDTDLENAWFGVTVTRKALPPLYPAADLGHATLEVKYNHFLPGYVKDILSPFGLSEVSNSKYVAARRYGLGGKPI